MGVKMCKYTPINSNRVYTYNTRYLHNLSKKTTTSIGVKMCKYTPMNSNRIYIYMVTVHV